MKFLIATGAMLLLSLTACRFEADRDERAHPAASTARTEYQRSETIQSNEGTSADLTPGATRTESHTKRETKIIREQQE